MRFILFSSLLLLASQRCRAARTRLRRRRAASDSFTGTSGCDLNGNNNTTRTATEESVQVNPCMFCDEVPRRCTTLNREDRFSFIHISKSGGASWIDELNKMKLGEVFPYKHTGKEWYLYYQKRKEQKLDQSLATHHLTSLRSPRHHMWSMWAECRWDTWGVHTTKNTTFPRSGTNTTEDVRDFTKWVDHYVNDDFQLINGTYKSHYGGCYHPANYQTRPFVSKLKSPHSPIRDEAMVPDVRNANVTAFSFDWLAVTDFFHQSKCLLYYRVQPRTASMQTYLDEACHCSHEEEEGAAPKDINVRHYKGRRRHTMLDLDDTLLRKIDAATKTDQEVFKAVLQHFMVEITWLETSLKRRVMCKDDLAKWEPEMVYLGLNVTELYERPRFSLIQEEEIEKSSEGEDAG